MHHIEIAFIINLELHHVLILNYSAIV
jgi:hypothetical protein